MRHDRLPALSVLFARPEDAALAERSTEPGFFGDLNLDQVVASLTGGRGEYRLEPFFHTPLTDDDAVAYRHEVLRDLEDRQVRAAIEKFAQQMRDMRKQLETARKLYYQRQKQRWFVDAAGTYSRAVRSLTGELNGLSLGSRGLRGFAEYLTSYLSSEAFTSLVSATGKLYEDLAAIRYSVHIKGSRVRVSKYEGEPDFGAEVEKTFAKFKQGAAKDHLAGFRDFADMNHVEEQILDLVARLYPQVFGALDGYCESFSDYPDPTVTAFDREIQFYLAYLDFTETLGRAGLPFCYPQVSAGSKQEHAEECFDLALAAKLAPKQALVRNGYSLTGPERIVVVTGPNQGGKTTFARMFGQVHYLASLGLQVPGKAARLLLPDQVFTHFEREEDITTLRGKLEDELTRIHGVLQTATGRSVLVMNESFTSTTLSDALFLGTEIMHRIIAQDMLCVYVTFADELASLSEQVVSMVAGVGPDDPAQRTYQVVRKSADGLAYAAAIAAKYGLTYQQVKERIAS